MIVEPSQPRITTFLFSVVCGVLCGRVCGLLFLLQTVVWRLFVVFLCAFIYVNDCSWFILFFYVLLFIIYFFWSKFMFLLFFLVFAARLSGVLSLSPATYFAIVCCGLLCLHLWKWLFVVPAFFYVLLFNIYFLGTKFVFFVFLVCWQHYRWWCSSCQRLVWGLFVVFFLYIYVYVYINSCLLFLVRLFVCFCCLFYPFW